LVRVSAEGFHPLESLVVMQAADVVLDVVLTPGLIRADETVIVAASRTERVEATLPRSTTVIGLGVIEERAARTAPEILQDQSGGWVQRTNHGGGSPFVRGLVGNQVLVLIDGIRLNNATFRLGPNQYMNTIDAFGLERVEVLRGSGSVAYGSDAVGGVVNLITPKPVLSPAGRTAGGSFATRLAGQGMEASVRGDGFVSGSRVAARAGVTYRAFGDLVAGGSLGTEAPSAYNEADVDASVLWAPRPATRVTAVFQNVHQSDVPRYDQVAQRGYAVYSFDPQVRRLGYVELDQRVGRRWLEGVRVKASWHRSEEGRVRRRQNSAMETREEDVVSTVGMSADLRGRPSSWFSWNGGVEVYDDTVRSWRRDTNLSTGTTVPLRGLYPDGATRLSTAAFVMGTFQAGRAAIDLGSRYTRDDVRADDRVFGEASLAPDAVVSSVAVAYPLAPGAVIFASVAQAFRAPNIDDLSTLGPFDFGIEAPPGALAPERSVAFEAGLKLTRARVAASASAYRINLQDLIDREQTTFNGSPTLEGQQVYRRANLGAAYVRGVEADIEWRPTTSLSVFAFGSTTYGRQEAADVPLRRIPPANGLVGVRQRWSRGPWIEATVRMARTQDRLAPGDRSDHRIPAGGTPGWVTANISGGVSVGRGVSLVGGVANVFNEAYRVHGSGIDSPGRHLWLTVAVRF
jgi:outer membrane receptor protein involved in Fe transport